MMQQRPLFSFLRLRRQAQRLIASVMCVWFSAAVSVAATPSDPTGVCDQAAAAVAAETGVPLPVLRAITRTETGRTRSGFFGPWPWTVNHAGRGLWFDRRDEALAYLASARREGARNFDVGCFQINFHWHGHVFASLADMLDPVQNAQYAAEFLTALHAEFGDWEKAAGAFHSRTPEFATRYLQRYRRIYADLPDSVTPRRVETPPATARRASRAPQGLDLRPRSSLFAASRAGTTNTAPLVRTSPARPLWEARP